MRWLDEYDRRRRFTERLKTAVVVLVWIAFLALAAWVALEGH